MSGKRLSVSSRCGGGYRGGRGGSLACGQRGCYEHVHRPVQGHVGAGGRSEERSQSAGGSLAQSYDRIGVAIARSSSASFADQLGKDKRIEGVSNTAGFATQLTGGSRSGTGIATAAPWGDALSGLQWDMAQIHVPEAHAINEGSPSVVVGDLDTGLDFEPS